MTKLSDVGQLSRAFEALNAVLASLKQDDGVEAKRILPQSHFDYVSTPSPGSSEGRFKGARVLIPTRPWNTCPTAATYAMRRGHLERADKVKSMLPRRIAPSRGQI